MFNVNIDRAQHLIEFVLGGEVTPEEMDRFVSDFRRACEVLDGKEFRVLGDVRTFGPTGPEVVQKQSAAYQAAIDHDVARFAEIVESEEVATELNRMGRQGGTDELLRRFADAHSARSWLQSDD